MIDSTRKADLEHLEARKREVGPQERRAIERAQDSIIRQGNRNEQQRRELVEAHRRNDVREVERLTNRLHTNDGRV